MEHVISKDLMDSSLNHGDTDIITGVGCDSTAQGDKVIVFNSIQSKK